MNNNKPHKITIEVSSNGIVSIEGNIPDHDCELRMVLALSEAILRLPHIGPMAGSLLLNVATRLLIKKPEVADHFLNHLKQQQQKEQNKNN